MNHKEIIKAFDSAYETEAVIRHHEKALKALRLILGKIINVYTTTDEWCAVDIDLSDMDKLTIEHIKLLVSLGVKYEDGYDASNMYLYLS